MTYSRRFLTLSLLTLAGLIAATPAGAAEATLPTDADNQYVSPPIPKRPAVIALPSVSGIATLESASEWKAMTALTSNLAKKAACVRQKKCRVSGTQIDIWYDDLDGNSEALQDEIIRSYDERLRAQEDALYDPQYQRRQDLQVKREEYLNIIDQDFETDQRQIDAFDREQSRKIDVAYRQLSCPESRCPEGATTIWNGQQVTFQQLIQESCQDQNPAIPPMELDDTDQAAITWYTNAKCEGVAKALAQILTEKPKKPGNNAKKKEKKAYAKAFKVWFKKFQAATKAKAACDGEDLQAAETRLEGVLEKLKAVPAKKRDAKWRLQMRETRVRLEMIRLALGNAEAYDEYEDDKEDYDQEVKDQKQDMTNCVNDSREEAADGWAAEMEKDLEEQIQEADDNSRETADDNRDEVARWYENSNDLVDLAEEREFDNVYINASKIRFADEGKVRRLETKARAYLRAIDR